MTRLPIAVLACTALCQAAVGADALFALDSGAGRLVSVDIATGSVDEIGLINSGPGYLLDFAAIGEHLYGLVWEPGVGSRLLEISTSDATVLSSVPITVNGAPSVNATEALASTARGTLLLSLWRPGASGTSASNSIGTLGLDGSVTGIVGFGSSADFDGLGIDPAGGLVGLDREPGPDHVDLLNVAYPSGAATLIIRIPFGPTFNYVDDVVVMNGEIITLDQSTHRINHHDRATGVVTTFVEYPATWQIYAGLAVVNVPDACAGDLDGDGSVGAPDLAILLGDWGTPGPADLDGSGSVTASDLALLLGAWGPCP